MITLEYGPNGNPISDFEVQKFAGVMVQVSKKFPDEIWRYKVSNQLLIDEVRRRVAIGEISHKDVELCYDGEIYPLNRYGRFDTKGKYPLFMDRILDDLVLVIP